MNSAAEIMSYAYYADAFPKGLFPFRCLVPLAATALDIVRLSKKRRKVSQCQQRQDWSPATQHRGHGASTGASSFFGFPKPWASMSFFACKRKQGAQGKAKQGAQGKTGHTVPCSRNRCCIALFGVSVLSRGPNEILRTSRHAPHPRCLCGNTRWSCHPAAVQPKAIKTHLNFFFGSDATDDFLCFRGTAVFLYPRISPLSFSLSALSCHRE